MEPTNAISIDEWLRILLVFSHVVICAFAITAVLKTDLKIFIGYVCRKDIEREARKISLLLAALWVTGLAIIYLDTGFSPEILMAKSKILLKLLCVLILTINGWLLHHVSFPALTRNTEKVTCAERVLLAVTGALSTSHWMLAAFIGMTAPLGQFPFRTLLSGYLVFVGLVTLVSLSLMPIVIRIKNEVATSTMYIEKRRAIKILDKVVLFDNEGQSFGYKKYSDPDQLNTDSNELESANTHRQAQ